MTRPNHVPFGVRAHELAAEPRRPPLLVCGAASELDGRPVVCNLPPGPHRIHALRDERRRPEKDGPATTVYQTICRWADGAPASSVRS